MYNCFGFALTFLVSSALIIKDELQKQNKFGESQNKNITTRYVYAPRNEVAMDIIFDLSVLQSASKSVTPLQPLHIIFFKNCRYFGNNVHFTRKFRFHYLSGNVGHFELGSLALC